MTRKKKRKLKVRRKRKVGDGNVNSSYWDRTAR